MKLHLPKLLLTAVMAACVAPAFADYVIETDVGTLDTLGADPGKLIVNTGGSATMSSSVANTADSVEVNGGTLTLTRTKDHELTDSFKVTNKGTLIFNSTDIHSASASNTIEIDDSTWTFNGRAEFGKNTTIKLKDATVNGGGDSYGAMDFNANNTITSSGTSTIDSVIRLRGNVALTFDVSDTLTVKTISDASNNGQVIKAGTGTLKLTSFAGSTHPDEPGIYAGNTTLQAGTIEYALTGNGTYNGTISGTGNIVNSGSATVTLAKINNLTGNVTVSNGTLNITSLGLSGNVTVSNGTLNITSLDMSGVANLSVSAGASLGITSTIDGSAANVSLNGALVLNHTGDMMSAYESTGATFSSSAASKVDAVSGYASGVTYIIARGVETKGENFSIAGYENGAVSWVDGNILLQVGDTDTSTFFVNEDAAWGTDGYTDATAKTYIVAAGKTFDLKLSKVNDDFTFNSKDIVLKAGATLKNSGTNAETGAKGLESLTIQGDASIDTGSHIALLAREYGATALNLNGNKLTKSGAGVFYLVNTTISAGTIEVTNGTLQVSKESSSGTDTILTLSGGHVAVDRGKTLKVASLTGTSGSSTINGEGTLELVGGTDASTAAKLTGTVALKVSKTGGTQTVGVASGWTGNVNAQSGGVKLVMDADSILDRTRITKGNNATITLSGSGTYNMVGTQSPKTNAETGETTVTDDDMNPLVSVGSDWTGTVRITNALWAKNYLDQLGNRNSTVELEGLHGWMNKDDAYTTITTNLKLINYVNGDTTKSAFIFNDHSQNVNYRFRGKVSGTGDFQVASQAGSAAHIHFEGDTSEWKGGIKITGAYSGSTNNPTISINMTGGGHIFDATGNQGITMDRAGTINLNIGKADADSTMNGAIAKGDKGTLALAVKGNTTFKQNVDVSSMSVDAGKTVKLEGDVTTGSFTLGADGTLEFTGGSLTVSSSITLSTVSVDFTKYFDVNELTKTLVTAESINNWAGDVETTYNVGDVGYTATIAQVENKITLSFEEIITSKDSVTTTVIEKKDDAYWYTLDGTTLTLNVQAGSLTGLVKGGLVIVEDLISDEMKADILASLTNTETGKMVTLKLTDGNTDNDIIAGEDAIVGFFNEKNEGYFGENVGNGVQYNVNLIPEPASATLSLAALMMLCARRRRQK